MLADPVEEGVAALLDRQSQPCLTVRVLGVGEAPTARVAGRDEGAGIDANRLMQLEQGRAGLIDPQRQGGFSKDDVLRFAVGAEERRLFVHCHHSPLAPLRLVPFSDRCTAFAVSDT